MGTRAHVRSSTEIERKYEVAADAELPDLTAQQTHRVDASSQQLRATYYDTGDLRLARNRITLRHRTGDDVAGWHLKLPGQHGGPHGSDEPPGREELHVRAGARTVPVQLHALVRSVVRTEPLQPVASLTTVREVRLVRDADGGPLAEVVDDRVDGRLLLRPDAPLLRWREWEAECKGADARVLDRIEPVLLAAGAQPSQAASKLGRVLALALEPAGDAPWWERPGPATTTAAATVQAHLHEQLTELVRRDPQVRQEVPDALHKMRVATRRLRSTLRTFAPLLERRRTDPLRRELAHLARVLGEVRDAEVLHARILTLIDSEPDELVLGPVRRRTDTVLGRQERRGRTVVLRELDGARYLRLLDDLHAIVADPPFTPAAHRPAGEVLPTIVRRTLYRLERTMRAAEGVADGAEREALLHEARKRAKTARYAAEAVRPAVGKPASKLASAMEELQELLGDYQDGAVTRTMLRELGVASSGAGENGFTFGRLHALEQRRAEATMARWPEMRARVSRPRRRWLDAPG